MAWHYYTENREKIGPFEGNVLKQLVRQGIITPETFIEDPTGRTGLAKDVKGLTFPDTTSPEPTLSAESSPFTTPVPLPQVAQTVPIFPIAPPLPSADNPFGRILASGDGVGHPAIPRLWTIYIICAVACCVIGSFFAFSMGNEIAHARQKIADAEKSLFVNQTDVDHARQRLNRFAQMGAAYIVGTILAPIICIMLGVIYHGNVASTYIQVYRNGIEGKGVGKFFILGDPRSFGFLLAYGHVALLFDTLHRH